MRGSDPAAQHRSGGPVPVGGRVTQSPQDSTSFGSALDKPVQYLRGVGPGRAKILAAMGIETAGDLINYFPFRYEEQGRPQAIDTLLVDESSTVIGVVDQVRASGGFHRTRVRARISDGTGQMHVTWFNASYLKDRLQPGQVVRLFGTVGLHGDLAQMVNPKVQWLDPDQDPARWDEIRLIPVYPATAKMASHHIARLVETALAEGLPEVTETLPESILARRGLCGRAEAIRRMHRPLSREETEPARRRLAYEELFHMQLAITLQRRWAAAHAKAPALPVTPLIDERIRRRFPFALTPAQDRVIADLCRDLASDRPMTRLLQGDVGSGKTVVALYAALVAIANRHQCAILAPTEVLAAQHSAGIDKYLADSRVRRCLLTGKTPAAQRRRLLNEIALGGMDLIVGTQALLEERVEFSTLGLVIVDEQHKFGVSQRATMRDKTAVAGAPTVPVPHYLVMTATPIPRTLSMTVFGDLDVSAIDELPPGRQPIVTRLVRPKEEPAAWLEVRRRIAEGDQVYIVYPLVEESDELDVKAATREVHTVGDHLLPGARVGLLHGRMSNADKRAVMERFAAGELDVLVATTVIEVGVDVPNATVMVVQHAERYGLSALHQLRGRVGRGTKPSVCLLFSHGGSDVARQRVSVLCDTTDGFRIAEEDLRIRGPGELLGTRQHGWPEFRVANLVEDVELLMQARDDAARIVQEDPALIERHAGLRAELRRRFRDKVAFIDVG